MCYPCVKNTTSAPFATFYTCTTLILIALVTINIMALYGHFNHVTIGIVNTCCFAATPLFFCFFASQDPDQVEKRAFISSFIICAILAGVASLAIPQILSLRTVVWITIPIASLTLLLTACGTGALTHQSLDERGYR